MKRLTFKPEHVDPIKDGTKKQTCRWRDQKINAGEIVAAVSAKDGKPAFLTPASERFALLLVTHVESKPWRDFTDEDAAKSGVDRAWYLQEKPDVNPWDPIFIYTFEKARECPLTDLPCFPGCDPMLCRRAART